MEKKLWAALGLGFAITTCTAFAQDTKTSPDAARDGWQKPDEVVAAMNVASGMTLADIGTGTGYMLPYLSRAVGPKGKVYGEDIQTGIVDKARAQASADRLTNVEFVVGTETDPKLPPGTVDMALLLDVYHMCQYPEKMLVSIAPALKPGGKLVIVDFYKVEMPEHVRLDRDDVRKEVESHGFRLLSEREHITSRQYMLTFAKP